MSLKAGRSGINNNLVNPVDGSLIGILSADQVNDLVKDVYADAGVLGAKNLCESICPLATIKGITFTKNIDGSYTISGTNDGTGKSICRIDQSVFDGTNNLKAYKGRYTISLLDVDGNCIDKVDLVIMQNLTWETAISTGSGSNGVNTADVDKNNCFTFIQVDNNADFTIPKTVYPMLRLATDTDDTYQPYSMTNQELTALKANKTDLPTVVPFSISASSSVTLNVSDGTCVEFKGFGLAASMFDLIIFVRSNHTVEVDDIYKGTNITYTKAANAITIANGAAGVITGYAIVYAGSVTVATS